MNAEPSAPGAQRPACAFCVRFQNRPGLDAILRAGAPYRRVVHCRAPLHIFAPNGGLRQLVRLPHGAFDSIRTRPEYC
jgi:hypothetical protein